MSSSLVSCGSSLVKHMHRNTFPMLKSTLPVSTGPAAPFPSSLNLRPLEMALKRPPPLFFAFHSSYLLFVG